MVNTYAASGVFVASGTNSTFRPNAATLKSLWSLRDAATHRRFSSFHESPSHFYSTHDPLSVAVLEESPPNVRIRTRIDAPIGYEQPLNRPRLRDRSLHRYNVLIPWTVVIAEVRRIRLCLQLINGIGHKLVMLGD